MKKKTYNRRSGILLHPTSLPGKYGIGDLGQAAYDFIDFLKEAGQTLWQILPLIPSGFGNSPYASYSAFAGQPLIISPDKLVKQGLLTEADLTGAPEGDPERVDFDAVIAFKNRILKTAFSRFDVTDKDFVAFCEKEAYWLDDFALFMTLKELNAMTAWQTWPAAHKSATAADRKRLAALHKEIVDYYRFVQYIFRLQWDAVHAYANAADIQIIGDLPIFVSSDSSDVWANQEEFLLDPDGYPTVVAGVPPDYFCVTGQKWGNPIYNWEIMKKNKFIWWITRMKYQLTLTDIVRLDHFRGFQSYWAVPADAETAVDGEWCPGPREALFDALLDAFDGELPIIAEDLGIITPDVTELRKHYDFPGMYVLQFGFEAPMDSTHLPYNYDRNGICYTGTHDNNTTRGWYDEANESSRDKVRRYLSCDGNNIHWDFIRLALGSAAKFAIFPLQDVFGLDAKRRMNIPGVGTGNWGWRYLPEYQNKGTAAYLKELSTLYYRNIPEYEKEPAQETEDIVGES